ncbi:hypothetical protein M885DRAFT_476623, partial [Pelagophyceae sp. CCMP2097]
MEDMGMGMDMGVGAGSSNEPEVNDRFRALIRVWRSEEACPEVLSWRGDLFDELQQLAESQEDSVEATKSSGTANVDDALFLAPMYEKDLARVRYVLGAYVRCRLAKIQRHAGHIATDEVAMARLSDGEQRYCERYLAIVAKHHRAALLSDLPPMFSDGAIGEDGAAVRDEGCPALLARAVTRPFDLNQFVFARVTADLGDVVIDDETEATQYLGLGDVHVLRYDPVKTLAQSGDLE